MSRMRTLVFIALTAVTSACNNPARMPAGDAMHAAQPAALPAQPTATATSTPVQSTPVPESAAGAPAVGAVTAHKEFRTEPVKPGYQRFDPPAIEVPVGASEDWAQFVGGPLDHDYDVVDVNGVQSVGGHHALVYATTTAEPAGTTRLWKDEDQLSARLMGGIGGEGGANVSLPAGIVFRVRKGSYILIQTHYLNATDKPILGRTVIDLKLAPTDPSHRVASMMSNTSLSVSLAPQAQSQMDVYCTVQKDLQFLMISNHMHDWGASTLTEFMDPQGVMHELKKDVKWSGDLALNPAWTRFPVEKPGLVPKGSTLHTHCTWQNDTAAPIKFPTEMCVFFGFVLNENDIYCTDNKWSEASSASASTETAGSAGSMAVTPANAGTSAAAGPRASAGSGGSPAMAFGCTGERDKAVMDASDFSSKTESCALSCFSDPDVASCSSPCFERTIGLSPMCAACNATNLACSMKTCFSECLTDSAAAPCRDCVKKNCDPPFRMCTGT